MTDQENTILIKKYSNRRLYNTQISEYITHQQLIDLIKADQPFKIVDAESKEDITRNILIQILFEQEQKGYNLFPNDIIKQLIKAYDSKVYGDFSSFLAHSINMFFDKNSSSEDPSSQAYSPMKFFNDITKKNMEMFGKSMQIFASATASSRDKEDE